MRDRSLEEINPVKLLLYALIFISICATLILFLLFPTLEKYKESTSRENSQLAQLNVTKAKLNASESKLELLRNENNKSFEQFEQNFDIRIFANFLQKYFKNIQIKENKISQAEEYLKYSLTVKANMNSPKNLYDFIDDLKNFDYLIKIDYPLNLKAAKEGIDIDFVIKIYSASSLN